MVSGFCCGEFGFVEPTAHTSLAAIAVTPVSSAGPFVFGADDSVQFAPSQCSINAFAPLMLPTAQTSLAETASTAASEPPWAFAPVTPVQDEPFHRSMSGEAPPSVPTAHASEDDTTATPKRSLPPLVDGPDATDHFD